MLIRRIDKEQRLAAFLKEECCDEGIGVNFDSKLTKADYRIIKVDDYFNSLRLKDTPPSPGCLIIKMQEWWFCLSCS